MDTGWKINLTGAAIPVYQQATSNDTRIGTITKNECFACGNYQDGTPYEGWGEAIVFLNASHEMQYGAIGDYPGEYVSFADYASNGSSWVRVWTLERTVKYPTRAYYADGTGDIYLPAGSKVTLTEGCSHGQNYPNYIAVTDVTPKDKDTIHFDGNGFVDLTYDGRWINVGSILLRKPL